jgi:hypothetical protein
MSALQRSFILLGIGVAIAASGTTAAAAFDPRDFAGSWDRYPPSGDATRALPQLAPPTAVSAPPLKPEHLAQWQATQQRNDEAAQRGEPLAAASQGCLPGGMPSMMWALFPMEILQTPGRVTIIQEVYSQVRRITMNAKLPAAEDADPGYQGSSVGHWEGHTLVINTIGIKDSVRMRGVPHSDAMRITERLRRIGRDHLENVITVTDPEYLTKPWVWIWLYQRVPNYQLVEFYCESDKQYADPTTGALRMKMLEQTK